MKRKISIVSVVTLLIVALAGLPVASIVADEESAEFLAAKVECYTGPIQIFVRVVDANEKPVYADLEVIGMGGPPFLDKYRPMGENGEAAEFILDAKGKVTKKGVCKAKVTFVAKTRDGKSASKRVTLVKGKTPISVMITIIG